MHGFLKSTCIVVAMTAFVCTGSALAVTKERQTTSPETLAETLADPQAINMTQILPRAHRMHDNPGCCGGMNETPVSAEKQARYAAIVKEAEAKMMPLQEQMMAKRIEIQALAQAPKTDQPAIAALAREMAALHSKLVEAHDQMTEKLAAEMGVSVMPEKSSGCSMGCGKGTADRHGAAQHQGHNMMGLMPIMPVY